MQTTTTLTEREANLLISGGYAGVTIGMTIGILLALYVVTVIATWKVFKKAGEPGWKCLIPFYNTYIMYKIVGAAGWFWGILAVNVLLAIVMSFDKTLYLLNSSNGPVVLNAAEHIPTLIAFLLALVVSVVGGIIYSWRTSKAFGHGAGYFIGLLFFQPIFWLIIGFGKSKYNKKAIRR